MRGAATLPRRLEGHLLERRLARSVVPPPPVGHIRQVGHRRVGARGIGTGEIELPVGDEGRKGVGDVCEPTLLAEPRRVAEDGQLRAEGGVQLTRRLRVSLRAHLQLAMRCAIRHPHPPQLLLVRSQQVHPCLRAGVGLLLERLRRRLPELAGGTTRSGLC